MEGEKRAMPSVQRFRFFCWASFDHRQVNSIVVGRQAAASSVSFAVTVDRATEPLVLSAISTTAAVQFTAAAAAAAGQR